MRENKKFSLLLWLSITSGPLFPSITNQETVSSLPSHNLNTQNLSITSHKVKHNSRNNKIGRQLSLFHLLWHELQRGRVDTVAESCWLWPVRKDMTQMSCTLLAVDFCSHHGVRPVSTRFYNFGGSISKRLTFGRVKGGPAAAWLILCLRTEQICTTANTLIHSICKVIVVCSTERRFSPSFSCDIVLFRRQFFLPVLQGHLLGVLSMGRHVQGFSNGKSPRPSLEHRTTTSHSHSEEGPARKPSHGEGLCWNKFLRREREREKEI